MILTLNETFEGYTPKEIIDDATAWREEYLATNGAGEHVRLIVFDVPNIPEAASDSDLFEMDLYYNLNSPVFHKPIERDNSSDTIRWIALEHCRTSLPLSEWIDRYGPFDEKTASDIAVSLAQGLDRLCTVAKGGGHYNLCLKNIEIQYESDNESAPKCSAVFINGLGYANTPIEGNPPFSPQSLDPVFRAPETRFGKYNYLSDIYSLGVVMYYLAVGVCPWDLAGASAFAAVDARREHPVKADAISKGYLSAVNRALTRNVNLRAKVYCDIVKILNGGEADTPRSVSTDRIKRHLQQSKEKSAPDETDNSRQYDSSPQPKCNVEFTELTGNGFSDVAGMEEVKRKFRRNFIDIVNYKEMAKEYDIMPPSLTLLAGPQGCGKTYLTKKLAEECNLYFSYISPAQLGNIYIHGSQRMIADLFQKAEAKAKAGNKGVLLMIDEFDALAPTRTTDTHNGHNDEVNELLTQINECSARGIYVIAATNRPDILDTAITRSGRMDDFIYIGLPDKQTRIEMFELGLKRRPHEPSLDLNRLGDLTDGYTNSDIDAIIREAGRTAFDQSVSRGDGTLVKISQELIESTISSCRPSVSSDEIKEYENMRDQFLRRNQKLRRRVGF